MWRDEGVKKCSVENLPSAVLFCSLSQADANVRCVCTVVMTVWVVSALM